MPWVLAVVLLGSACGGNPADEGEDATVGTGGESGGVVSSGEGDGRFDDYGFPAYVPAEHWCSGRVYGDADNPGEIGWDIFLSPDPPDVVLEFYRERIGDEGLTPESPGGTWHLSEDGAVNRTLAISDVAMNRAPPGECPDDIPDESKTGLFLSRMSGGE